MHPFIALADPVQTSWEFLTKGGIFMLPLGLAALGGLTAILFKFLSLSRGRVMPDTLALKINRGAKLDDIEREAHEGGSTLARLVRVAMRHRDKPPGDIILAVEASAREEASRLHAGIGVLDVVITVAPLLGLLGTASGLIAIFDGLGDSADYMAIALGIAKALNTTIFGLAIAVPCVVAHGYFTRRIEVFTARLEALLAELASACQAKQDVVTTDR